MPISFASLKLRYQCLSLVTGKGFSLNHLSLHLPLLLQLRILRSLQALHRGVHRWRTHTSPLPVEPARPKGRVLGLPEPNGPHLRAALRVAEPEIEGQVIGTNPLVAGRVERGRRPVLGLGFSLVGLNGRGIGALWLGSERRRWFESVRSVEFGSGGGEVAREEGGGGGILAGNTSEDRHEGLRVHSV